MLYFSRQYVPSHLLLRLILHNLRIPATTPTYPLSPTHASSLAHPRILPRISTYPLSPTPASPSPLPRILSRTPTYPPLAYPGSLSRTPIYSHPLLQVDAPSLIPTQAITSTNISSELRAPTSPSPRTSSRTPSYSLPSYRYMLNPSYLLKPSHQRTSPPNYAHPPPHRHALLPLLIRTFSPSYT